MGAGVGAIVLEGGKDRAEQGGRSFALSVTSVG